jgi:ATP-binding cassette, subfamily F, member 3
MLEPMLIKADIIEKHMGTKLLFKGLSFTLQENAKVGLIGRNGIGKSTLFGILTGDDTDYAGEVERRRNVQIVMTAQEHFLTGDETAVDYVLNHIPDFHRLKEIVETYPDTMGDDMAKIHEYTEALDIFIENNYYAIDDLILEALSNFDIDLETAMRPLHTLSGGQKRFVELVKVGFSRADLLLLDEPTNHLDYHGKTLFLRWLKGLRTACCIISHDRDVLKEMDTMVEIKDYRAFTYPGNYDAYIRQNGVKTVTEISQYESALKRLEILRKQILEARVRKQQTSAGGFKQLEIRLQKEYDELKETLDKPSFWIDRATTEELGKDDAKSYDRYKSRTIKIGASKADTYEHQLIAVSKLSVGYDKPLFEGISFRLEHGDRLQLRGRNGAGKSTLLKTVLAAIAEKPAEATIYHGEIKPHGKVRVGVYEQEVDPRYLGMALGDAVKEAYAEVKINLDTRGVNEILAQYLFEPTKDRELLVKHLSGGQKARLQLIRMLCGNPNLLILDEPTNHLDLPSIEELEDALLVYPGAVIFVSHDSYFLERMGGEIVQVGRA